MMRGDEDDVITRRGIRKRIQTFEDMDTEPILVRKPNEEEEGRVEDEISQGVRVDILGLHHQNTTKQPQHPRLSAEVSDEILGKITDNTAELQIKLNRFINALNSKFQSVRRIRRCC